MKKIIIVLIFSLGLISCEKESEQELSFEEVCELFDNYDVYGGLTTLDFANSNRGNAELWEQKCSVRLENMRALFEIVNGAVVNIESTIDGKSIDFEIWRVKVFNLYYNL